MNIDVIGLRQPGEEVSQREVERSPPTGSDHVRRDSDLDLLQQDAIVRWNSERFRKMLLQEDGDTVGYWLSQTICIGEQLTRVPLPSKGGYTSPE